MWQVSRGAIPQPNISTEQHPGALWAAVEAFFRVTWGLAFMEPPRNSQADVLLGLLSSIAVIGRLDTGVLEKSAYHRTAIARPILRGRFRALVCHIRTLAPRPSSETSAQHSPRAIFNRTHPFRPRWNASQSGDLRNTHFPHQSGRLLQASMSVCPCSLDFPRQPLL